MVGPDSAANFAEIKTIIQAWKPAPVERDLYSLLGVPRPDPDGWRRLRPDLTPDQRADAERIGRLYFRSAYAQRSTD